MDEYNKHDYVAVVNEDSDHCQKIGIITDIINDVLHCSHINTYNPSFFTVHKNDVWLLKDHPDEDLSYVAQKHWLTLTTQATHSARHICENFNIQETITTISELLYTFRTPFANRYSTTVFYETLNRWIAYRVDQTTHHIPMHPQDIRFPSWHPLHIHTETITHTPIMLHLEEIIQLLYQDTTPHYIFGQFHHRPGAT